MPCPVAACRGHWAVGGAAGPLVYDTFTGANGTNINGRTPDIAPPGSVWSVINAAYAIQSNRAVNTGGPARAIIDSTISDGTLTVIVNSAANASRHYGFLYRSTDNTNWWGAIARNGRAGIIEVTGGANWRATDDTYTFPTGTHTMTLVLDGANMSYAIDGSTKASYSSAVRQTVANHGMYADTGTTTEYLDDFTVESL